MYPRQYHPAMIVTIDCAGRIVVPKSLRERFNLVAGTGCRRRRSLVLTVE